MLMLNPKCLRGPSLKTTSTFSFLKQPTNYSFENIFEKIDHMILSITVNFANPLIFIEISHLDFDFIIILVNSQFIKNKKFST